MGWQNVEVPATKIVFDSGDEMRCSHETAFVVDGRSKKAIDLQVGDRLGINVVRSIIDSGNLVYFLDRPSERQLSREEYLSYGGKPADMSLPEYIEFSCQKYTRNCQEALKMGFQPMENGWGDPAYWRKKLSEAFQKEL